MVINNAKTPTQVPPNKALVEVFHWLEMKQTSFEYQFHNIDMVQVIFISMGAAEEALPVIPPIAMLIVAVPPIFIPDMPDIVMLLVGVAPDISIPDMLMTAAVVAMFITVPPLEVVVVPAMSIPDICIIVEDVPVPMSIPEISIPDMFILLWIRIVFIVPSVYNEREESRLNDQAGNIQPQQKPSSSMCISRTLN